MALTKLSALTWTCSQESVSIPVSTDDHTWRPWQCPRRLLAGFPTAAGYGCLRGDCRRWSRWGAYEGRFSAEMKNGASRSGFGVSCPGSQLLLPPAENRGALGPLRVHFLTRTVVMGLRVSHSGCAADRITEFDWQQGTYSNTTTLLELCEHSLLSDTRQ